MLNWRVIFILFLSFYNYVVSDAQQSKKFMTYNIRLNLTSDAENCWEKRKEMFLKQILFVSPDVFGVQEALPEQVADIQKYLSQYSFVGHGRDENGTGEASNIFYNKNQYKVLETNTFWLSETPDKVSKGWDAALNRICTYALLQDKKNKQKFFVFNTHFDHQGTLARKNAAILILDKIETINTKKYPCILMGDFNGDENTAWIQLLSHKMIDSKTISPLVFGPNATFNGFQYDEIPTERIDFIFVNAQIIVKKYATLVHSEKKRFPSDHFPVVIECQF